MNVRPHNIKQYESYAAWRADQSKKNQELIDQLQSLIERVAPHLTTSVKWGQGCWLDGTVPRVYIHTEADHVQLGFYNGSALRDPQGLLNGKGKYVRFITVRTVEDIDPIACSVLVQQATADY